jgi:hypothetical protein
MDASRGCLKFYHAGIKLQQIRTISAGFVMQSAGSWGLTAHGLFILRCSNYLVMLRFMNLM